MLFVDLAATSAAVTVTSGRRAKVELLATALTALAATGDPLAIEAGAAYLAGEMRQRQIGVGWAGLRELPAPAVAPTLTVREVDARLADMGALAGAGSQARRRALVQSLFGAATTDEQRLLRGIISGEVRQGAQAGLLADAIASAARVPLALVRRALLLSGDFKTVAGAALSGGAPALGAFRLTLGRPLAPMLAQAASGVSEALTGTGSPASVDVKLDGIRVQVHRDGDEVAVFSRSLDDITARVPEIVAVARSLPARALVLDGEALAVDAAGRARPFQETSGQAARQASGPPIQPGSGSESASEALVATARLARAAADPPGGKGVRADLRLVPYFFDLLHLDGVDLVDEPGTTRWAALDSAVSEGLRVARTLVDTVDEAEATFATALAQGYEGVVIKAVGSPYDVGRRGSAWVKVKPRHTLDLVVLAAEWGHGRRRGWLSNLHLGARDPAGGFVMLGKTFKGMTDAILAWQTARLLELATDRGDWVVTVRPELVVEIAFDGIQASTRYPGGVTLRFARVLRYREDKSAGEADTIEAVRSLHTTTPPTSGTRPP